LYVAEEVESAACVLRRGKKKKKKYLQYEVLSIAAFHNQFHL
jgi:hypothetical protein